jgi:hypothetical protein
MAPDVKTKKLRKTYGVKILGCNFVRNLQLKILLHKIVNIKLQHKKLKCKRN